MFDLQSVRWTAALLPTGSKVVRAKLVDDGALTILTRHRTRSTLIDTILFVRPFSLGCSVAHILVGMALGAAAAALRGSTLALGIGAGVLFHIFAFVGNDVRDLPIDRTDPRRVNSPLVRGLIRPRTATLIASIAGLAFLLVAQLTGTWPQAAVAFGGLLAYNLWGKRTRYPILLELVQGAGWGALVIMGATWVGSATPPSWLAAGYVLVFIMLANAAHGGLRDLTNDTHQGAFTTPRVLGCRSTGDGLVVGRAMTRYVIALEAMLTLLTVALVIALWPFASTWSAALMIVALSVHGGALLVGRRAWRVLGDQRQMMRLGIAHLLATHLVLVIAVVGHVSLTARLVILLAFVLPPLITTVINRRWSAR